MAGQGTYDREKDIVLEDLGAIEVNPTTYLILSINSYDGGEKKLVAKREVSSRGGKKFFQNLGRWTKAELVAVYPVLTGLLAEDATWKW
jgi:hypothetical protein